MRTNNFSRPKRRIYNGNKARGGNPNGNRGGHQQNPRWGEGNEPNFNTKDNIDEYGISKSRSRDYIEREHKKYGYSVDSLTGNQVNNPQNSGRQPVVTIEKIWRPDANKYQSTLQSIEPQKRQQTQKNTQRPGQGQGKFGKVKPSLTGSSQGKPNSGKPNSGNPNQGKPNSVKPNRDPNFKPNPKFAKNRNQPQKPNNSPKSNPSEQEDVRLNKFLSQQGVVSRRKADLLIEKGKVTINGKKVTELGTKINPGEDRIVVNGEQVANTTEQPIYLLLNKPKDTITTRADEKDRKIVMDLIKEDIRNKIVPVGRLDRDTTGVLLLTNDGELTYRLTHPSYEIPRSYLVTLNESITKQKINKILSGIELEDGLAKITSLEHTPDSKRELILTLQEGKNREVRRIFEALGYEVEKLDRINFGGITSEGLQRGEYRPLSKREIAYLKSLVKLD